MRSPSYHDFSRVPSVNVPRSAFDLSARYKTTFDSGKLIPCMCPIEILPGDSINLSIQSFARLTTPVVPFMDNLVIDYQFFFVPNRLVWENFQRFMGEKDSPGDSIDYVVPTVQAPAGGFPVGSIADYFGLPTGVGGIKVNALPFRALNLIWNEWYRPEFLANSKDVEKGDGPDDYTDYSSLLPRYNRLDYFQGALPSPQSGPSVGLPLNGVAPVRLTNYNNPQPDSPVAFHDNGGQVIPADGREVVVAHDIRTPMASYAYQPFRVVTDDGTKELFQDNYLSMFGLYSDLSEASGATINTLRQAFQIQLFLERSMLGGERYTEILRSMFGVVSPDARLQRPEFLGQGSLPIVISTVPQTSSTDQTSPQGNLAAFGLTKGKLPHIRKSFTEHGFVIGLMSCRAPITYQQGIDRMWSRKTRFDYYWPVFAHLGEQAVLNKEIYAQGTSADEDVFGYQERYAEYRYGVSHVTGKLRSTASGTLDYWHLGVKYNSLPQLGDAFAQVNVPLARVLAVQNEPQFVYDSLVNCKMYRCMPLYSVPGRIDHF